MAQLPTVQGMTVAPPSATGYLPAASSGKTCHDNRDLAKHHRKPNCSYTVLTGMALKGSMTASLPVSGIYQYIE